MHKLQVLNKSIGDGERVFIIAEIGINHNGSLVVAHDMIDEASKAKVDAVKFQTYVTETFIAKGNPYYSIFKQSELSNLSALNELKEHAEKQNLIFFSSATDEQGLSILSRLDLSLLKISSANITNMPLLEKAAKLSKPMIISTGGSRLVEVMQAVELIKKYNSAGVAVLKCTSLYPCPPEKANLKGISALKSVFDCPIGFSDHTNGVMAAVLSVGLGASIIEKHFTLDKNMEGHDHHFSADPKEMGKLVKAIRQAEAMLGSPGLFPVDEEESFLSVARRYVTALTEIPPGVTITATDVGIRRPQSEGQILPADLNKVLGRTARRLIKFGDAITWDDI